VIVNTQAARHAVQHAARGRRVPVHVLPHPFPELSVPRDPPPEPEPLLVTLGWIDPVKRPHDLIRAVARVHRIQPCRLAFVGEVSASLRRELEDLAREVELGDRVVFTGFTDVSTYVSWLARADIVVQLRAETHGEASGALCDAVASGRPVLTSIATAADLPPGVVARIEPRATVAEIAHTTLGLLLDAERRVRLATAAREHAATWRYHDLARAVTDIVREHGARRDVPIATAPRR
jgi:glycosyltransferase involved in cell wall biosynthesis